MHIPELQLNSSCLHRWASANKRTRFRCCRGRGRGAEKLHTGCWPRRGGWYLRGDCPHSLAKHTCL